MLTKFKTLILINICCSFLFAAQAQEKDQSSQWKPLIKAIQDVLAGHPIESRNIIIAPGAYLAFGDKYENLKSVTSGESKTCSLKEDSTRGAVQVVLKINDSEDAGFITLKTQTDKETNVRYHTVVFMKDSSGDWIIEAWHTSS